MLAVVDGGQRPSGTVRVSGAKNSATRLLAAALLTDQRVELTDFPTRLVDVNHKVNLIRQLGGRVELDHKESTAVIAAADLRSVALDDYDCPIRTTYLLVAAQILRSGIARIPYPGGCKIGSRGYDMHVMVWERFGCEVNEHQTHIEVRGSKFRAAEIRFPISTVGGTENALLCAAVADGASEIINAYITPEVEDLIALLRAMGAHIDIAGTSHIRVQGRPNLSGARRQVMPDRIEALTWMVYAVLARGSVLIERVPFDAMRSPLLYLESAGVDILRNSSSTYIHPDCLTHGNVQPVEVPCGAHPGVISDMQPFFVMLALAASGISRIYDYRYPERVGYVNELAKFFLPRTLTAEVGKITVQGPGAFQPATATSTDLRGSMALLLAALCADGRSVVKDAHMALRGYNDLEGKLAGLGVTGLKVMESDQAALIAG
jgi:UDP-N-acetylglucosamine 1-carboxyvinyltransferase